MNAAAKKKKYVEKSRVYAASPERVWTALTDPRALAEWLMPTDFEPVVGKKFRFQCDPHPGFVGRIECEVLECDPPKRLSYTWHEARHHTVVSWMLEPHEDGTRLTLQHEGFEGVVGWIKRTMLNMGWGVMTDKLIPGILENIDDEGRFVPGVYPLEKRYYTINSISDSDDLVY